MRRADKEARRAAQAGAQVLSFKKSRRTGLYIPPAGVNFQPYEGKQEDYYEALMSQEERDAVVTALGPAGTGKTFVACAAAFHMLQKGLIKTIHLTRPVVAVEGEDLGFFPGSKDEKLAEWMVPYADAFTALMGAGNFQKAREHDNTIVFSPMATMRGSSFDRTVLMVDEAQNTSYAKIKMLLTRIGEGSKIILSGDPEQSDIGPSNGLKAWLEVCDSQDLTFPIIEFNEDDIVRSGPCKILVKAFRRYEKERQ